MAGAAPRFEKRRYVPPGVRAGRLALISVAIGFLALLLLAINLVQQWGQRRLGFGVSR